MGRIDFESETLITVGTLTPGAHPGGYNGQDAYTGHLVTHALKAEGCDASEDGTGRGTPLVATFNERSITSPHNRESCNPDGPVPTLHEHPPTAFTIHGTNKTARDASETDLSGSVRTKPPGSQENSSTTVAISPLGVRRMTPRECERLQGFPDDHTLIEGNTKNIDPAKLDADVVKYFVRSGYVLSRSEQLAAIADTPRYRSLGNSMAVPVIKWIGERIECTLPVAGQGESGVGFVVNRLGVPTCK